MLTPCLSGGSLVTSLLSMWIEPVLIGISPAIASRSTVLPAPVGPISAKKQFSFMSRLMSWRSKLPSDTERFFIFIMLPFSCAGLLF